MALILPAGFFYKQKPDKDINILKPDRQLEQNMYAVIESGGKQHRVTEGEVLKLEKIEAGTGDKVSFDKVLMVGEGADVKIGTPYVDASVTAEVLSHGRGDKVKIIKFKRRKHHEKQQGHRQWFTEVKITEISAGGKAAPKKAAKKAAAETDAQ